MLNLLNADTKQLNKQICKSCPDWKKGRAKNDQVNLVRG